MNFVEAERIGSVQAVDDMARTAVAIYQRACQHDGLPVDAKFTVFSPDNPFVPFYEKALSQWREMAAGCAAHGYVGLSTNNRSVYKRKKR